MFIVKIQGDYVVSCGSAPTRTVNVLDSKLDGRTLPIVTITVISPIIYKNGVWGSGWDVSKINTDYMKFTEHETYLLANTPANSNISGSVKADVTNYNKLHIKFRINNVVNTSDYFGGIYCYDSYRLWIDPAVPLSNYKKLNDSDIGTVATYELDISSIKGEQYIGVVGFGYSVSSSALLYIYEMWLE